MRESDDSGAAETGVCVPQIDGSGCRARTSQVCFITRNAQARDPVGPIAALGPARRRDRRQNKRVRQQGRWKAC